MEREFSKEELRNIIVKIENSLKDTFSREGMAVFDVNLVEKPKRVDHQYKEFWGGYKIEFKVVPNSIFTKKVGDVDSLRRNATVVGPYEKKIFEIEISKFEYCTGKIAKEINGYTVYVYTTEMIVLEKIRSICQQNKEYKEIIKTHNPVARARDFFDIYILLENFPLDLNNKTTKELFKAIFSAKKVPLDFIYKIGDQREFHRTDFISVQNTVKSGVQLKEFDFYFDYVLERLLTISL